MDSNPADMPTVINIQRWLFRAVTLLQKAALEQSIPFGNPAVQFAIPARGKKAKGCGTELLEEAAGAEAALPCNAINRRLSCFTPIATPEVDFEQCGMS